VDNWVSYNKRRKEKREEKEEEVPTTTLDGYSIHNNANFK
jgi:hypothetical protein